MRLLLDTHVFLWFISGDSRLSSIAQQSIRDPANDVFLSVVSLWEAILKHGLGKLPLSQAPEIYLPLHRQRHNIASLPIDEPSVAQLAQLPNLHRDPFDRMLLCQARAYDLTLVTVDPVMRDYPVSLLFAT